MAASRDLRSRVTDLATCPICLALFNSPKSLPCLHTFCLKCIEGHCRDNKPGDEAACPVCRQKFNIPERGVRGLVSNFFIADLVEARKTASDVLLPIGSETKTELVKTEGGKCDKHRDDDVRLYCFDCKMNVCLMCFAEDHQQHKCRNVSSVAGEFVKQIDADLVAVNEKVDGAKYEISRLDEERGKFLSDADDVRNQIISRGEELKKLIDAQVNELMAEVQSLKIEKCKEIESLREDVEVKLLAFKTFSAYCSELKLKGKPCDITRAANDLHTRATELLQNDVTPEDYRAPAVVFMPMNIQKLLDVTETLIGRVVAPRVVNTLSGIEGVFGVTSLDDELCVLLHKEQEQVEVYNTTTTEQEEEEEYRLVRRLSVPGVGYNKDVLTLFDMTSCKHYRCLYIADSSSNCCVHRVELNGKVTKLSVNNPPWGLSVTSQFTVLVTCLGDSKLLELTTEGKQLREITLQPDIVGPLHAIQLSNGQFVVCHGWSDDPVHRVCIVDTNGHVTQSYGGPPGSATVGQLNGPVHLAVDKNEFIFVADRDNSRVLLLSPTLSFVREIVSRDQLNGRPFRLFLDVDRRRLYVAIECQVVVIQL